MVQKEREKEDIYADNLNMENKINKHYLVYNTDAFEKSVLVHSLTAVALSYSLATAPT